MRTRGEIRATWQADPTDAPFDPLVLELLVDIRGLLFDIRELFATRSTTDSTREDTTTGE